MDDEMKAALTEYGRTIQELGWRAGEDLIYRGEHRFPDFRRWAYALAIVLRAREILMAQ